MRITKDEARILASAIEEYKYKVSDDNRDLVLFERLTDLENKLDRFGKDKRRTGRTSQDNWRDALKRYSQTTRENNL